MVWYKLKIGLFDVRYTPLKPTEKSFPYCDKEGNILERVIERGNSYFIDKEGNKHFSAVRLINNKPMAKLSKTKEVSKYIEVNKKEVEDLLTEKEYIVDSPLLLKELSESGKALKFGYTAGNGYKVYIAYVYPSKLYKNLLFMSLGRTTKSELIRDITLNEKDKKEIEVTIEGIDKAKIEDLLEITA